MPTASSGVTSRRIAAAAVLVAALLLGYVWLTKNPPTGPFEGEQAPPFELVALDGTAFASESLRGRPVFINFWATWCDPCLEEMPIIQRMHEKYGEALAIVAVTDEPVPVASRYIAKYGYTFPAYVDPGGFMTEDYLVHFFPTSLFVDASGVIRGRHAGQLSEEQMEAYIRRIL